MKGLQRRREEDVINREWKLFEDDEDLIGYFHTYNCNDNYDKIIVIGNNYYFQTFYS
jgi:hypothetical protein